MRAKVTLICGVSKRRTKLCVLNDEEPVTVRRFKGSNECDVASVVDYWVDVFKEKSCLSNLPVRRSGVEPVLTEMQ